MHQSSILIIIHMSCEDSVDLRLAVKQQQISMSDYTPYSQFFLFGDSLIQNATGYDGGFCFSAALQQRYERRLDVVNRGFSGYNTDQALRLLPKIMGSPENGRIKYLLCLFGANDACLPTSSSNQHVPLPQYAENLKKILNHPSVRAHSPKIILVVPPPVDGDRCVAAGLVKGVTEVRRLAAITAEYCKAARAVGESELGDRGVVVDLWTKFMDEAIANTPDYDSKSPLLGSRSLGECKALVDLLHDGLHMTAKGYKLFFDAVVTAVSETWPADDPEKMEMVHPEWSAAFK